MCKHLAIHISLLLPLSPPPPLLPTSHSLHFALSPSPPLPPPTASRAPSPQHQVASLCHTRLAMPCAPPHSVSLESLVPQYMYTKYCCFTIVVLCLVPHHIVFHWRALCHSTQSTVVIYSHYAASPRPTPWPSPLLVLPLSDSTHSPPILTTLLVIILYG